MCPDTQALGRMRGSALMIALFVIVVMALLAARGINEVHVEAGPTLCGALLRAGLADELLLYMAPLLMGEGARPLLAGLGIGRMAQAWPLEVTDLRMVGGDLRLLLRPDPR